MSESTVSDNTGRRPRLSGLPAAQRCLVMGVVNVTPDSFSDGGHWLDPDKAIAHGLELASQGADIVDIGGESTRPGAQRVPMAEELGRVLPVVEALAEAGCRVSIDTMRAEVASARAGGRRRHGQRRQRRPGRPGHGRRRRRGRRAVRRHALARAQRRHVRASRLRGRRRRGAGRAWPAGCRRSSRPEWSQGQLILDPGLGFAKLPEHNWKLLASLDRIARLPGYPRAVPCAGRCVTEGLPRQAAGGPDGAAAARSHAATTRRSR